LKGNKNFNCVSATLPALSFVHSTVRCASNGSIKRRGS